MMTQTRPLPDGMVSCTVTLVAAPGPSLVTVIVKVEVSPALTVPLPDLVTRTFGQSTVSVAEAVLFAKVVEASLVAATVTVFGRVPQSAAVVARDRVIVRDAPLVRVPKAQLRTPAVIEQSAAFAPPRVQVPLGRVSCAVTAKAVPGQRLLTVMLKVAVSPALIVPLPVLITRTSGQITWSVKDAVLSVASVSWVALTRTALGSAPQSAAVVARDRLMVTALPTPGWSGPVKVQVRTPLAVPGQ